MAGAREGAFLAALRARAPREWDIGDAFVSGGDPASAAFRVELPGRRRLLVLARVRTAAPPAVEVRGVHYTAADGGDNVLFRLSRRDGARASVSVTTLEDDPHCVNTRVAAALGHLVAAGWHVGEMASIYGDHHGCGGGARRQPPARARHCS